MKSAPSPQTRVEPNAHGFWLTRWWHRLPTARKDRFASLGPVLSVLLFLSAILAAITYFTLEEQDREQEAITRDVEYAQQRLRLRLLELQDQLMRLARNVSNGEIAEIEFGYQSDQLVTRHPELLALTWLNDRREVVTAYASPSAPAEFNRLMGSVPEAADMHAGFKLAHDQRLPTYVGPGKSTSGLQTLTLLVPLNEQGQFSGVVVAEFSIDGLLRFGIPPEVMAHYAVALLDGQAHVLAGSIQYKRPKVLGQLPWSIKPQSHEIPISPIGENLVIRAVGYRTDKNAVSDAFFWVMGALSCLTVWILVNNMRHTRRRIQAQRALVAETNFRRAMENSMLTGMRALDPQGRITYVNPAFCSMTGWSERELVGAKAPFPYWADGEHESLMARLKDELEGHSQPGGYETTIRRKDGSTFAGRMYVSPLIDPSGQQTGWMASITDITEPKRVREELTASYERFTTVLDSIDAAISVAPLGSTELLFGNKLYRNWFGTNGRGHRTMLDLACAVPAPVNHDSGDQVDGLAGLPTSNLLDASAENTEVYIQELDKWIEIRTRYLTWVDGRLAQMLIVTDITSRRRVQEQAAKQAERAESASRLITMGEMASSVAHELNQPLTAISNYCSGMISRVQKQQISEESLLEALEKTARQAQRAGQIIQRIRAFVKRSEPNPTLSDVAQMVSNASELAEIELSRHRVRLDAQVAPRLPRLMVDPILIEQVLINLIKNGGESIQQANRPNTPRQVELAVDKRRIDDLPVVEFRVRDHGSGIPPQQLEHIYEAFYSTKSEGMGIGLKLCRSIVESHHGRLQARNIYNDGAMTGCEFSFWIPVPATVNS